MNATTNTIQLTKEMQKNISKLNHYSIDQFERDCKEWIEAIRMNRTICIVESVSASGMSRTFKYLSYVPNDNRSYFRTWYCFLSVLGYSFKKDSHAIKVGGCGMDMNFATTYNIAHSLKSLGIISKEECEVLAQQTPSIQ